MRIVDEIYTETPFYGSRKITAEMNVQGYQVNRKRIQKYMRIMGIEGIAPGPNTSKPHPENKIYPYLLRGVTIERVNHVWSTDITYGVPGVQGEHGCLNEPQVYLKYINN